MTENPCGTCEACCTWLSIEDALLPKPAGVKCPNLGTCGGCRVYDRRPRDCREFNCVWLVAIKRGAAPPLSQRPDRCGVMLDAVGRGVLAARCAPGRPTAWRERETWENLERAARAGATVIIDAVRGSRRKLVMTADLRTGRVKVKQERFTAPDANGEQRMER